MSGANGGLSQRALDSMAIEAAVLDAEGAIILVNQAWQTFADENHGTHQDAWVGENYFDICKQSDDLVALDVVDGLQAVLDGNRKRFKVEYPCHSPEEERWFLLDTTGFTMDGERYLFVCHIDVTDGKLAALRSDARREQLETAVGVLTHDIRNPLQVIDTYAALLADDLDDERITSIRDAVTRIAEITETTLAFSQTGALSEVNPLSVADLAHSAWETVPTEDATLVVQQSQQFHGDRRLMAQLFENLFRNAIEHAGADCTVTIGALSSGFYVADDGAGIPAGLREKAVEADFSTRGTQGLGLAIVQSVARAHGGGLRITDAESGGARFEFTGFEIRPAGDTE